MFGGPRSPVRALALAATALVTGCILLVEDRGDLGLACSFADSDRTRCGKCIATSCGSQVNACCADADCRGQLPDLDRCASDNGCAALTQGASGAGPRASLAACVSTSCASACTPSGLIEDPNEGDGGPSDATAPLDARDVGLQCNGLGASGCVCQAHANGTNSGACSATSLGVDPPTVICCSDATYPADGTQCTCQWVGCHSNGASCVCGPGFGSPGGVCTGQICCRETAAPSCVCSGGDCVVPFDPMTQGTCGVADLVCPNGQHEVTACK